MRVIRNDNKINNEGGNFMVIKDIKRIIKQQY